MGWSSEHIEERPILKKQICDQQFAEGCSVVKSAMVGSTYYAAVRSGDTVFAAVTLTRVDNSDWFNFWTKGMTESEGPVEAKCPVSILSELSDTEDEFASEWRQRCLQYAENTKILRELPIGAVIEYNGSLYEKMEIGANQRKAWVNTSRNTYVPMAQIAEEGFDLVQKVSTFQDSGRN